MKFGEHISAHITPEWRKQYIQYEVADHVVVYKWIIWMFYVFLYVLHYTFHEKNSHSEFAFNDKASNES